MITYRLHLIRTGSTSAALRKRCVGQLDLPLCKEGAELLRELRSRFKYPEADRVYASELRRCVQTAEILYPEVQITEVGGLKDMSLGEFEGYTLEQLRGGEAFSKWLENSLVNTPPGGESASDFTRRVVDALDWMLRDMMNAQIQSAAVITHGGVIMTMLAAVGLPQLPLHRWSVGNGTGYTLLTSAQMWMRGKKAEASGFIPELAVTDGLDAHTPDLNGIGALGTYPKTSC